MDGKGALRCARVRLRELHGTLAATASASAGRTPRSSMSPASPHGEHFAEVVVVRHGETSWNASRVIQGRMDPELNEIGRQQATMLARRLSKEAKPASVYSSDLKRAADTAQTIATVYDVSNGGGESLDQLSERCVSCLNAIAEKHKGKQLPVFSTVPQIESRSKCTIGSE
nr:unnamed protein product [Digitaria exilis]